MTTSTRHHTDHTISIDAHPDVIYGVVAGAKSWPQHFAPTVYVSVEDKQQSSERLRIWATANGEVRNWTSRRELDPKTRRVRFEQEICSPPVAAMSGEWIVLPEGDGSKLILTHDFAVVDDSEENHEWVHNATEHNSNKELANIKELAEKWDTLGQLSFDFEDTVRISGKPEAVYEFLYRAQDWPQRLPHVSRLDLVEDTPGVQVMSMDTKTKDGSVHTTESVRVCFPHERIVYKQTTMPALMTAHTGEWSIRAQGDATIATSRHTVMLNQDAIATVLGQDATVGSARLFVYNALSTNSTTTLRLAKEYAEAQN